MNKQKRFDEIKELVKNKDSAVAIINLIKVIVDLEAKLEVQNEGMDN